MQTEVDTVSTETLSAAAATVAAGEWSHRNVSCNVIVCCDADFHDVNSCMRRKHRQMKPEIRLSTTADSETPSLTA
jgi:hypothetical protein